MSKPIIAEVLFVDPFRNTEELVFRGPLVEAYQKWRKYRQKRPFAGEFTVLKYENPDGTMVIKQAEGWNHCNNCVFYHPVIEKAGYCGFKNSWMPVTGVCRAEDFRKEKQ